MDETYVDILNNCIEIVEELLSSYSYEELPFCRLGLASDQPHETRVWFIRGTKNSPAEKPSDPTIPNVLVKDSHEFDECWPIISSDGKVEQIMNPSAVPKIDALELAGILSMPVEILCRGITKSLSPKAHARMFGR